MPLAPDTLRAWAEVDLGQLERNLANIRAALPPHLRYVAVIKADAYGHGSTSVATRLMRARADLFAVANIDEAAALREIGSGWPILILSAVLPSERTEVFAHNLTPTVSSAEEVRAFAEEAHARGRVLGVHLKIDTGMGRLGVWHGEAAALASDILSRKSLRLEGVYTHFACADSDAAVTAEQRDRFLRCLDEADLARKSGLIIHADNSAGIDTFPRSGLFNGARVGLLQFGVRPYAGSLLANVAVEPVFSFHTRIALVKSLPAGTSVSYGHTHTLRRPSRLAILAAGYADGIPTRMSNRGRVLIHGYECPVVGRVTMDQTLVDITDLPQPAAPGDTATFIGTQGGASLRVEDFAAAADQIPWETFCSISKRVRRVYRIDSAL
ncbi:MAG: alanine racemase [Opitutales bacterium]|nr:alanine racemase [Opitutales bacterium]